MTDPKLTGQAGEEWEKIERLVGEDVECQVEDHLDERRRKNNLRALNGLPPI